MSNGLIANAVVRSSQNQLNRLLRDFIDDIKVGKRDGKVITETLYSASRPEQDEAWDKLKQELQDVGVAPEMLVQDRETIMSTLRKAADQEGLLQPAQKPGQKPLEHAMPPADNRISDKEAVPIDDFPIPLTCELQDVDDSSKHAVPRDDFPILVSTEPPPDDFDKQVLPPDLNLPIPVETASTAHSQSGSASDKGSSVSQARSAPPLSISRGKKPSLMSRMKYKMSSSKSEFLTLIEMGGLYSIKFALDRGADVNSYDNAGKTALMIAVSLGLDDVVSLLLEYGAKIDQMGDHGDTALGIAALKGYDDIVQLLLVSGASPDAGKNRGKTALSQAVMRNSLTITKMLIAWGADINAISSSGNTALSCAALNGCYPIVQFLLENGAVVDKTSYPRQTPLYKAVSHANARCARLLLTFGADPHQKDSRGQSPMDLATTSFSLGKPEMLDLFHEYGFEDDAGPAGTAAPPPYQPPAGRKSILGKSAFQYS